MDLATSMSRRGQVPAITVHAKLATQALFYPFSYKLVLAYPFSALFPTVDVVNVLPNSSNNLTSTVPLWILEALVIFDALCLSSLLVSASCHATVVIRQLAIYGNCGALSP